MTVERGIDPRRFVLMPFGGAGPLHAASMAQELGIGRVLCPRACGVLCALGLAAAAPRRDVSSTVMLSAENLTRERVVRELGCLIESATAELDEHATRIDVRYELRYRGQSFELTVDDEIDPRDGLRAGVVPAGDAPALLDPALLRDAFEDAHERRYGYRDEQAEVELVNVRVSAIGRRPALRLMGSRGELPTPGSTRIAFDGEWIEAELWRGELPIDTCVQGPALCALPESTLLVPPGWNGTVDQHGTVVLEQSA
jgi:N-methylhydantoinase A